MKRICLVYTHLPHYRIPVFRELLESTEFDYTFYYDPVGIDSSIVSGEINDKAKKIRTFKFGRLMFQPGALILSIIGKYDGYIFLGNPYIISNWLIFIILRFRNRKIFLWTHGWINDDDGLKDYLRTFYYRLANYLMLYGERARDIGIKKGFSKENMSVIYNSLNYSLQADIRVRINNPTKEKLFFLFVGRITSESKLDIAIEAMALINKRHSEVKLLIVGDGVEVEKLKLLSKIRNANVLFEGGTYQEEKLGDFFMRAVAVISPGKVGLLAMHAFAYGVPVITIGNPKIQMPEYEIIEDGITGSLCSELTAESFATKMEFWLHSKEKEATSVACIKAIEEKYTPQKQKYFIQTMLAKTLTI